MATINLKTRFFILAFVYYIFPPRVVIDGGEAQKVRWGDNTLQVTPGNHHLKIYFRWLWIITAGKAKFDVSVQEGQTVDVVYKAPSWFVFLPGKVKVAAA
jgi:hypothetical protein